MSGPSRPRQVLGDNFKEEELPAAERAAPLGSYALITESLASSLSTPLVDSLTVEILSLERALTIRKRHAAKPLPSRADGPDAEVMDAADFEGEVVSDGGVGVLENAICTREAFVIDALRVLCKAQLESAHIQPLLARCVRLFKHQIALFKWLPALPALAPPKPKLPSVYKKLIEQLCGEESLCSAMYGMVS